MRKFQSKQDRERYICSFVRDMVRSNEQENYDTRNRWELAFDLFAGKQDWGAERQENEWMSRVFVHEFSTIVRKVAESMQELVFSRPDLFGLEASNPTDNDAARYAKIIEKVITYYIERLDLENVFYEFCLYGGITGVGVSKLLVEQKLEWNPEIVLEKLEKQETAHLNKIKSKVDNVPLGNPISDNLADAEVQNALNELFGAESAVGTIPKIKPKKQLVFGLKVENIDPLLLFWDNEKDIFSSPWICQRMYKKTYDLEPLFESNTLDRDKFKDLLNSGTGLGRGEGGYISDTYEGYKATRLNQTTDAMNYTRPHSILTYYGPLLDDDGTIIEENRMFIVANDTVVLKDIQNPSWSQKHPYFASTFSKIPGKPDGKGIADNAIPQQLLINELNSLLVDMMKLSVYNIKAIDSSKLAYPEKVREGLAPNDVIEILGGNDSKVRDIFADLPTNIGSSPYIFQMLESLKLSGQKGSGVDTMSSNPSSRARITAREVTFNQSEGTRSENALAREIDRHFIEPLVRGVMERVLQYGFEDNVIERLKTDGVLTESEYNEISNLSRIQRFVEFRKNYKVNIKGIRKRMEEMDHLRSIAELLQQLNAWPEARSRINHTELLRDVVDLYGLDVDRVIYQNSPQDKAREENKILENNQFIAVGEQDEDGSELTEHYLSLLQGYNEIVLKHIMMHAQRMMSRGETPPTPPKELEGVLPNFEELMQQMQQQQSTNINPNEQQQLIQ